MATPHFKEITDADFEKEVTQAEGIVFLEFYRDSCSSCRVFESTLNEIEELYRGQITFLRLSTDHGKFHYNRLECVGDPTCHIFYKGESEGDYTGASMTQYFQPALQRILKYIANLHKIPEPLPVSL